jgi:hypothetical protein
MRKRKERNNKMNKQEFITEENEKWTSGDGEKSKEGREHEGDEKLFYA